MPCNKTYNSKFGAISCEEVDFSIISDADLQSNYNWDCSGCDECSDEQTDCAGFCNGECNQCVNFGEAHGDSIEGGYSGEYNIDCMGRCYTGFWMDGWGPEYVIDENGDCVTEIDEETSSPGVAYQQYILGDCNLDGNLDNDDADCCSRCSVGMSGGDACDCSEWTWADVPTNDIVDFTLQACACDVSGNDGTSAVDASRIWRVHNNGEIFTRSSGTCQELSSMDSCVVGEVCDWCPPGETCV
tara:strand:- start:272 stop:1000 length:729 start_codon:yes stop_codon:yes gene_type:complete